MPTTYYAIQSSTNKWIKSINKTNNTFSETSFPAQVLEYTVEATAESDANWLANLPGESDRFHVVGSPKPH